MIKRCRTLILPAMLAAVLATECLAQVTINEEEETISAILNKEAPVEKCGINERLYSALNDPDQTFQFLTGAAGGTVQFSGYRNGKLAWVAFGEFGCSNGVVICGIVLPMKDGEKISIGYEDFSTPARERYVVFSHLRETVFRREFYGSGGAGLKIELQNGFQPADNDVLIPHNVFRYAHCNK
jgi:hypothetical protein